MKITKCVSTTIAAFVLATSFCHAAPVTTTQKMTTTVSHDKKASHAENIEAYVTAFPWINSIPQEVNYGSISIKEVNLNDSGTIAFVKAGERINGKLKYKIDADELQTFHFYHVMVGLKNRDEHACIAHSLGIWDGKGKATFEFIAPQEKGAYEVYFEMQDSNKDLPHNQATIGVVIVS